MTGSESAYETPFTIELDEHGMTTVVRVVGAAGADVCGHLTRSLQEAARRGPGLLTLDLAGMSFISSTGLGSLVAAHVSIKREGGMMCLLNPNSTVRDVLRITKLNTLFPIVDTLEEAEQLFSNLS